MKYCCYEMAKFLEGSKDKDVDLKVSPDNCGRILTVILMEKNEWYGWGVQIFYCPFCGKKFNDEELVCSA